MNRQQRRERERRGKKFEKRTHFTKDEVVQMNRVAYDFGVKDALEAAKEVLKLGPTRLARIEDRVRDISTKYEKMLEEGGGNQ